MHLNAVASPSFRRHVFHDSEQSYGKPAGQGPGQNTHYGNSGALVQEEYLWTEAVWKKTIRNVRFLFSFSYFRYYT